MNIQSLGLVIHRTHAIRRYDAVFGGEILFREGLDSRSSHQPVYTYVRTISLEGRGGKGGKGEGRRIGGKEGLNVRLHHACRLVSFPRAC